MLIAQCRHAVSRVKFYFKLNSSTGTRSRGTRIELPIAARLAARPLRTDHAHVQLGHRVRVQPRRG